MTYRRSTGWGLLILSGIIGLAGYFGPWLPHRAAGLMITGVDLPEYVKFIPEVISGSIRLQRQVFYLPLFVASVNTVLLASRRSLRPPLRLLLAAASIPLALAMLPPAWSPATLRVPEFHLQVFAIFFCVLLLPALPYLQRLPDAAVLATVGLGALAASSCPPLGYLQLVAALTKLYGNAIAPGWGFWATTIGFAGIAVLCIFHLSWAARSMRAS